MREAGQMPAELVHTLPVDATRVLGKAEISQEMKRIGARRDAEMREAAAADRARRTSQQALLKAGSWVLAGSAWLNQVGGYDVAVSEAVRAYYAQFGEREWTRLQHAADGQIEFAVTRQALLRYLPPHARVLDLGGGPGRYTIWLAEHGHRVTLADLSPELLAIARERIRQAGVGGHVEAVVEADARDLRAWRDGVFDAVVCLGPFYHLPDPTDRARAAGELGRVLASGGVAFVALMPRLAFLRRTLALADERRRLLEPGFVARVLEDGVFSNDVPGRFTFGYGARPERARAP